MKFSRVPRNSDREPKRDAGKAASLKAIIDKEVHAPAVIYHPRLIEVQG